jgi:hypothetical protein
MPITRMQSSGYEISSITDSRLSIHAEWPHEVDFWSHALERSFAQINTEEALLKTIEAAEKEPASSFNPFDKLWSCDFFLACDGADSEGAVGGR